MKEVVVLKVVGEVVADLKVLLSPVPRPLALYPLVACAYFLSLQFWLRCVRFQYTSALYFEGIHHEFY
jgi:hypothetical protein